MEEVEEAVVEKQENAHQLFSRRSLQRNDNFRKHVRKTRHGGYDTQTSTISDPGYMTQRSTDSSGINLDKETHSNRHSLDPGLARLTSESFQHSDNSLDSSLDSDFVHEGENLDTTENPDAADAANEGDFSQYAQNAISQLTDMIENIETNPEAKEKDDIKHSGATETEKNNNSLTMGGSFDLIESTVGSVAVDVARGVGRLGEAASNAWTFFSNTLDRLSAADGDSSEEILKWQDANSDLSEDETFQDAHEELTPTDRIHFICMELLTTEEVYVERLQVLVKVKEKTKQLLGDDIARQMFHDIETIYTFHYNYLLPTLADRLRKWGQYERIGDVMKKLAPFLKLYTEYVKDFQKSSQLVTNYEEKSSAFAALLKDAKANQPAKCGRLRVQTHMMEPVQRVPRYELLLKDYLKRLDPDSSDRRDTEEALNSVSQAANHFEEMMKRDKRIATLMDIQSRVECPHPIVAPGRELVKEGKLCTVGTKGGLSERHIYLFNDLILICTKLNLVVIEKFRVKLEFSLSDVWVIEGTNLEYPNTFCLRSWDSFVELHASSEEEKDEWLQALNDCKEKNSNRTEDHTDMGQEPHICKCSGQLLVSSDEGRTWKKKQLAVHTNGWLYTFRSPNETDPITGIKLQLFSKKIVDAPNGKKGKAILLTAAGKKYYFYNEAESTITRWMTQLDNTTDLSTKRKMSASRSRKF